MNSSPDSASVQMRSITELSEGSTNGVNEPLRASPSQATTSATTENTRAKPQSKRPRQRGRGRLQQRRPALRYGVCSRHCSIRFISI